MQTHPADSLRLPGSVATVGAFDGVHRGHKALIRRVVERAAELGVPSVAYTFDPPPRVYFEGVPMLSPLPEKLRRLRTLGLDHVVVAAFDASYTSRASEDFLEELAMMNPAEVWVGPDFRFGRGQSGGVGTLASRFTIRVFELVCCRSGEAISSSRVRGLLAKGAIAKAGDLLGWPV